MIKNVDFTGSCVYFILGCQVMLIIYYIHEIKWHFRDLRPTPKKFTSDSMISLFLFQQIEQD